MKKIGIAGLCLFLTLVGAANLSAGGNKETGNKTTFVRVWTMDAHSKAEYVELVDKWNAGTGKDMNVRIEYTVHGGDYQQALDVAMAADEEPDMFKANGRIPFYVAKGKLLPLKELPGMESYIAEFKEFQKEGDTMVNGVEYAAPLWKYVYGLVYNKELLKRIGRNEPPKTWAQLEADAIAISKLEPGTIFGTAQPCKYVQFQNYITHAAAPSVGHFPFNFTTGRYNYTDYIPIMEMLVRLNKAGAIFPGMETLDDDTLRAHFAEGKIGFIIGSGSFNVSVLTSQFPAKQEWGVAPSPVQDLNNYYNQIATGTTTYGISNLVGTKRNNKEAVAAAVKLITGPEIRRTLFTNSRSIPVDARIVQTATPSSIPQFNEYGAIGATAVLQPAVPDNSLIVEGDMFNAVITKILTGSLEPRAALADVEKRYNEALDKAAANGTININAYKDPSIQQKFIRK